MDLEIFKNLESSIKNGGVKEFINELSNYLENLKENDKESNKNVNKKNNKLSFEERNKENAMNKRIDFVDQTLDEKNNKLDEYREEDCLYQVVDRGRNGIYLQKMNNNVVFEETNIPEEIKSRLGNDYILRYKNGTYIFEEELTDKFFEGLTDINE